MVCISMTHGFRTGKFLLHSTENKEQLKYMLEYFYAKEESLENKEIQNYAAYEVWLENVRKSYTPKS